MKVIYKINQAIRNSVLAIRSLITRTPERVRHTVPYVSQFANPAWAEMVIKDDQPLSKDMLWPDSGAKTIEEYEEWALSACGMACASMLIAFYREKTFPVVTLARDARKSGVYTTDNGEISSMLYRPFVVWLRKFGVTGHVYTKLTFRSIKMLLASNSLIIVSVNPNIRQYNTAPATQIGGHLVLITGFNQTDRTITFHNPSGFENDQTQSNHTMPWREFEIYFAGRGIAVAKS